MNSLSLMSALELINTEEDEKIVLNTSIHPRRLAIDWFKGEVATILKGNISVSLMVKGNTHFTYTRKSIFDFSPSHIFHTTSLSDDAFENTQNLFFINDDEFHRFKSSYSIASLEKKFFDWSFFSYNDGQEDFFFTLSLRDYLETTNIVDAINETLKTLRLVHSSQLSFKKISIDELTTN